MKFARQSAGSLAALVFGVMVSIALPRVLGAEARGEYQLAVKVAGFVLAIAQWGIAEVLLQVLAERRESRGTAAGTSLLLGALGALLFSALVVLARPLLQDNVLQGVDTPLLLLALAGCVPSILGLLSRRLIQLDGALRFYNMLDVGRNFLMLLLVLVLGILLPRQAEGATIAWLVGECALAIVGVWYVWRRLGGSLRIDRTFTSFMLRAGAPIQISLVAMYIGNEAGAFVLNPEMGLAAVGVYSVALSVARLVLQISTALRTALQSRLVNEGVQAPALTARVIRHGLLLMLGVGVGVAVLAPLVPLVVGKEFGGSSLAVALAVPGMVAYGVWQLVAGFLLLRGRRPFLAMVACGFAVGSVLFQVLGARLAGISGATAGLSVAYILGASVAVWGFGRESNIPLSELIPGPGDLVFYLHVLERLMRAAARRVSTEGSTGSA